VIDSNGELEIVISFIDITDETDAERGNQS
jgi:hypothetical protein